MRLEVRAYELWIVPRPGPGHTSAWVFPYGGRNGTTKEQAYERAKRKAQKLEAEGVKFGWDERKLRTIEA